MRDLPTDIRGELTTLLDEADQDLELATRRDAPDVVQQRIRARVERGMSHDEAVLMGAAWGESARRQLEWDWIWLEDEEEAAIAPADRTYMIMPFQLLGANRIADADHRNTLLLYNMLKGGRLPDSAPGRLHRLG